MRFQAKAPLRIDFAGIWTDVPAYSKALGESGSALAVAINIYASGHITGAEAGSGPLSLLRGAQNAALHYELGGPESTGLGASAAQTLLWLTLIKTGIANTSERRELAERAWRIEQELGARGGKLDAYSIAVGGITLTRFGETVEVEEVRPGYPFTAEFEKRLLLVDTKLRTESHDLFGDVTQQIASADEKLVESLRYSAHLVDGMRDALTSRDVSRFASLLNESWTVQKSLHPSMSNLAIDSVVSAARESGAEGVKLVGPGGGRCLVCVAEEGASVHLAQALKRNGARIIPFQIDWYGIHLTKG